MPIKPGSLPQPSWERLPAPWPQATISQAEARGSFPSPEWSSPHTHPPPSRHHRNLISGSSCPWLHAILHLAPGSSPLSFHTFHAYHLRWSCSSAFSTHPSPPPPRHTPVAWPGLNEHSLPWRQKPSGSIVLGEKRGDAFGLSTNVLPRSSQGGSVCMPLLTWSLPLLTWSLPSASSHGQRGCAGVWGSEEDALEPALPAAGPPAHSRRGRPRQKTC